MKRRLRPVSSAWGVARIPAARQWWKVRAGLDENWHWKCGNECSRVEGTCVE
jgi:hypothetical protein